MGALAAGLDDLPPVAPEDLAALLLAPRPPLVLDARDRATHREGTVPGAVYVGTDPAGFLPDRRQGAVVLILPEPAAPDLAAAWAQRLLEAGMEARRLSGGVPGWIAAGFEVEQPEEVYMRPGAVPFDIPRGLCEGNAPAREFR